MVCFLARVIPRCSSLTVCVLQTSRKVASNRRSTAPPKFLGYCVLRRAIKDSLVAANPGRRMPRAVEFKYVVLVHTTIPCFLGRQGAENTLPETAKANLLLACTVLLWYARIPLLLDWLARCPLAYKAVYLVPGAVSRCGA